MHLVGIDLAWGERKPSGVAVLDETGRLLRLAAATDDDAVVAAIGGATDGPCVVAFDAPIIVANDSGKRPCETELNRDFARFDAGAHSTNRGRAEFAQQPRAARLAERLGLDVDPASTADRRGLEVYPHPATIALFRLGRVLAYKNKPGRDVGSMRGELLRLTTFLEGLAEADVPLHLDVPTWHEVVESVRSATRKSELRVAEDQVDAVVCAYVALLAAKAPEQLTTYGDLATGYIVTPRLPLDLEPAPRVRRTPTSARRAVQAYAAGRPELVRVTDAAVERITQLLDEAGINYLTISGRTKSVASFAAKAARTADGRPVYADPLTEITDRIGLRVITYVQRDVDAAVEAIAEQHTVLTDRDMGQETAGQGLFGYSSRHLQLVLDGQEVQVQVRTVLQHAWAEFEHDIRYKGTVPAQHARDFDRRFTLAAGLLELADREFSTIRDRMAEWMRDQRPEGDPTDPRISPHELAVLLASRFSDSGWSRTEHYAWISGVLLELGVTSADELSALLDAVDSEAVTARMGYRTPPGAVRRLDDALLSIFGQQYVELTGNAQRRASLEARLERLRAAD